jgi:hypothetical protein
VPEPAANHEQNRLNRRNPLLRAKNDSLASPATNRRRVSDSSAWGKNRELGRQPVLQSWKQSLFNVGTLSPNPWDLSLSGNNGSLTHGGLSTIVPPVGRPRTLRGGTDHARPTIAAAESALRSHPCGALSSAQLPTVLQNRVKRSRNIQ